LEGGGRGVESPEGEGRVFREEREKEGGRFFLVAEREGEGVIFFFLEEEDFLGGAMERKTRKKRKGEFIRGGEKKGRILREGGWTAKSIENGRFGRQIVHFRWI